MFIWTYIGYWNFYKEYRNGDKGILLCCLYMCINVHINFKNLYIDEYREIITYPYFMICLFVNITLIRKSKNM